MTNTVANIGKIERVDLRNVWPHEARDFTVWLTKNIDVLSDMLDIELSNAEREQSAGSFSLDILAEDETGNPVIIENQLGKSDHDHLGKLLTYLTAFDAKIAVWIVAEARPEHVQAITWLNEASSGSFYLLKVEAIRIGDSPSAPLLTMIVGPSDEAREVGEVKRDLAERHHERYEFWTKLFEYARTQTDLHANISPSRGGWVGTGAGRSGLSYRYVVRQHDIQVELYIDKGTGMDEQNKAIFDQLEKSKDEITQSFEGQLDWQRLNYKQGCRIAKALPVGGYKDKEKWSEVFQNAVDTMTRLEQALRPHISRLKL